MIPLDLGLTDGVVTNCNIISPVAKSRTSSTQLVTLQHKQSQFRQAVSEIRSFCLVNGTICLLAGLSRILLLILPHFFLVVVYCDFFASASAILFLWRNFKEEIKHWRNFS
jgi:hypothetical protein